MTDFQTNFKLLLETGDPMGDRPTANPVQEIAAAANADDPNWLNNVNALIGKFGVKVRRVDFHDGSFVFALRFPPAKRWGEGELYVITDPQNEFHEMHEASEWIWRLGQGDLFAMIGGDEESTDNFWETVGPGSVAYHATAPENIDDIMEQGLQPRNRTRGLTNRNIGGAVFATRGEPHMVDSYGDTKFVIHLDKMKEAGYMPNVERETGFNDGDMVKMRAELAAKIGLDEWYDETASSDGLDEETIVIYGAVPPQFLSLLD